MDEKDAIEELQRIRPYVEIVPQRAEALDVAINVLEEVQQYRVIGMPKKIKDLLEKSSRGN